MSWVDRKPGFPDPHPCEKPDSDGMRVFGTGSKWECDVCHAVWRFDGIHRDWGSGQNDSWDTWTRLTTPW